MPVPAPPQLQAALAQLSASLEAVEKRKVDLLTESWEAIERSVIKVLGGPFKPDEPEHQVVALGLASAFGARLAGEQKAFWFPNREAPEGAALGFPDALITLAPFGAVMDALVSARLSKLEDLAKEIRSSLGQAKFSGAAPAAKLRAEDYMRLFDPGFSQLVSLDAEKAKKTWFTPPEKLALELRDGISRAAKLPAEVKKQLEQQLVAALQRLPTGAPIIGQAAVAPRVCETMGLLFASSGATGSAPEEFWAEVVFPLLFIGAPASFPPLDDEELQAAKSGIDPLFLFLDIVPYSFKAPEDGGVMGAFPSEGVSLPDPAFKGAGQLRLMKVQTAELKPVLAAFDGAKTRDALKRFGAYLAEKTGPVQGANAADAAQMLDAALILLDDVKKVVASGHDVCLRRLTEAEAASEPALGLVRQSLQGPRIILTA